MAPHDKNSPMSAPIVGLHHVTAIAGDPQKNVDFFVNVLGLRLVKRTVNFDAPETYHLYYGDEIGDPGTILTFFPWPGAPKGRQGTGQVTVTGFSISSESIGYWRDRLRQYGVKIDAPVHRFEEEVLALHDQDGLRLELVAHTAARTNRSWKAGPVPPPHEIRGFHGVTISAAGYERTARLLTETMGFTAGPVDGNRFRFVAADGSSSGANVDVMCSPGQPRGIVAVGTVHHIAFRVPDDRAQLDWRERLVVANLDVTPQIDRQYFRSIYFREPGGVLFELATDPPGFLTDESVGDLGTHLKLPPWLEEDRRQLEAILPPIHVPVNPPQ
jgi:glyoxalase family protein